MYKEEKIVKEGKQVSLFRHTYNFSEGIAITIEYLLEIDSEGEYEHDSIRYSLGKILHSSKKKETENGIIYF